MALLWISVCFATLVAGCDTGPAESLWDPDAPSGADPVISEVDPPDLALAGVDIVTIRGQNFGPSSETNLVFFNATKAPILSASASELQARAPNLPPGPVAIRVAVLGSDSESFSNSYVLRLAPAAEEFGGLLKTEEAFSIAGDATGNVYVSVFADERSVGIDKFAPDGTRSDFSNTTFKWDGMEFGPDGYLYAVRNVRAVFRFPPEGGSQQTWAVSPNTSARFLDLDFDAAGNAWVVGEASGIVRVSPDVSITEYPFGEVGRAVKVVGNDLYVVATTASTVSVWMFTIDAEGNIGAGERFADLSSVATIGTAIEAAANGDLYVGTDGGDPVQVVHSDGSVEPLYPGVLSRGTASMAWAEDPFLVVVERKGDPLDEPKLVRINTRREGVR